MAHTLSFETSVAPFLEEHCLGCHSGRRPKGELDLSRFDDAASVRGQRTVWSAVRRQLAGGHMPPEDRPRPPAKKRLSFSMPP